MYLDWISEREALWERLATGLVQTVLLWLLEESIEHTTRAVIDGQIHDIPTVADTIYKVKERLEKRVREPLSDVSIAAAGRVLKTKRVKARYQFNSEKRR